MISPRLVVLTAALLCWAPACDLFGGDEGPPELPPVPDLGVDTGAGGDLPGPGDPGPTADPGAADPGATDPGPADPDAADAAPDAGPPECTPDDALFTCDDQDVCTKDTCEAGLCVHAAIEGCCLADADCEDGIACTDDTCNPITHQCLQVFDDNTCCLTAADCDDDDACTDDLCAANRCVYPRRPDAASCGCSSDLQCDDGNPCTAGACGSQGICEYPATGDAGCCVDDAGCDDGDPATWDGCQQSTCWNVAMPCEGDADCTAPTPCLAGSCTDGLCAFAPVEASTACCVTDADCDDGVDGTLDACVAQRCVHSLGASVACAADTDCAATACLAATCVVEAGQCSVSPTQADGCCATPDDCAPTGDACAAATCEAFTCGAAALTGLQPFWEATWPADDLGGWAVTDPIQGVGWQRSSAQAISAPYSLYYGSAGGGSYATSGPNSGTATSPLVTAPAGAASLTLTLWLSADIEPLVSTDALEVRLVDEGTGAETPVWIKAEQGIVVGWQELSVPITAAVTGPFRIRLSFDTVDDVNNDGAGIYVDDVRVLIPCD